MQPRPSPSQVKYRRLTSAGEQLETVAASRSAELELSNLAINSYVGDDFFRKMFARRTSGSQFLSSEECAELTRQATLLLHPEITHHITRLLSPWNRELPTEEPDIFLLDGRALQLAQANGTTRHALAIARALCDAIPAQYDIAIFTDPQLGPLPRVITELTTISWRPALLMRVKCFVQLATVADPLQPHNLDLLRAPWITTMSVFLDDIMGIYPSHFLGSTFGFWSHQLGIEKLRSTDIVLCLGTTSQAEAERLWSSLPEGTRQPRFIITSCLSGIPRNPDSRNLPTRRGQFAVFGNDLPHKNLALAAAALSAATDTQDDFLHMAFVSVVPESQQRALRSLANIPKTKGEISQKRIRFVQQISDTALDEIIRTSEAIILPSFHEGFSLPVVEALERNIPVLLSRIPAHQELLSEGPWFFDPRDVDSLVEAITRFRAEGEDWLSRQQHDLQERYSPHTLSSGIRAAVKLCLSSDTSPSENAHNPTQPELSSRPISTAPSSDRKTLQQMDAHLMLAKLNLTTSMISVTGKFYESGDRQELINILNSPTWKAGRIVSAPVRGIKYLLSQFGSRGQE